MITAIREYWYVWRAWDVWPWRHWLNKRDVRAMVDRCATALEELRRSQRVEVVAGEEIARGAAVRIGSDGKAYRARP